MTAAAIIGWLISLGLVLGAIGPLCGTCTQGGDASWIAGLVVFGPVGVIGLAIAQFGAPLGRRYLWLGLPHLITVAFLLYFVPVYFIHTTISGVSVCGVREAWAEDEPASLLQRLWAPGWVVFTFILGWVAWRYWSAPANSALLTDASSSLLRAQHGAAKRGR